MLSQPSGVRTTILRNGMFCGVLLAALTIGNAAIQNHRHVVGPSAQGLVVFTYIFFLIVLVALLLVGLLTTRSTGQLGAGWRAGAVAGAIPGAVLAVESLWATVNHAVQASDGGQIAALLVGVVALAGVVGALGALVSWPGAALGRAQYRKQHPAGAPQPFELPESIGSPFIPPGAALPLSQTYFAGVTIVPSWPKSLLLMVIGSLLAGLSYMYAQIGPPFPSWHAFLGLAGAVFFSLMIPVGLFTLIWNRPLLRFSEDGITYRGGEPLWRRGHLPWQDIHSIQMTRARNTLFGLSGRYDLIIVMKSRPRQLTFRNWQLPGSTAQTLELIATLYQQQIEAHAIVIRARR